MKHYQDIETGKVWAFEDSFDIQKSTNRRIPQNLTEVVKEKPNEEYFWYKSDWVHISDLPADYKEPMSSVPIYNPAWVTFLFPVGVYVWPDDKELLNISLEQINSNQYNGSIFQEVATTINLENSDLPALISHDGSLAIPMCSTFPNASDALNTINRIEGALFLGGLVLESTNYKSLECGSLSEIGQKIHSYVVSAHNRFRTNSSSLSERIILSSPNYIMVSTFKSALATGFDVLDKINNLSPNFIVKGHKALVAWDLSDALSNFWISIEQLTSHLWDTLLLPNLSQRGNKIKTKYMKLKKAKCDWKVSERHKLLTEAGYIKSSELQALNTARVERNKLVHSGELPLFEVVEDLWFSLLAMLEKHSCVSLCELRGRTSVGSGKFNKHYPPGFADVRSVNNTAFPEWPPRDQN